PGPGILRPRRTDGAQRRHPHRTHGPSGRVPVRARPTGRTHPMSDTSPLPTALDMHGHRVLVTGAANGIGRATAIALAQLGASLLLADRAPLAATHAEVERLQVPCETAEGDLTDDAFIAALL